MTAFADSEPHVMYERDAQGRPVRFHREQEHVCRSIGCARLTRADYIELDKITQRRVHADLERDRRPWWYR